MSDDGLTKVKRGELFKSMYEIAMEDRDVECRKLATALGVERVGRSLAELVDSVIAERDALRAELADERVAAVEAAKSYNASCSALVRERDALRAENDDLRRLCADEHSREGQAMEGGRG